MHLVRHALPAPAHRTIVSAPIRIIGIGSPFGGDSVGWSIVECLQRSHAAQAWGSQVALVAADRPGVGLIELWRGAYWVAVVDAVISGGVPGRVWRLEGEQLACAPAPWSSHGIGVAEALALARVLSALPERLVFFGVEIAPQSGPPCASSVEAAADMIGAEVSMVFEACHTERVLR